MRWSLMSKPERAIAWYALSAAAAVVVATAGSVSWVHHERRVSHRRSQEGSAMRCAGLVAEAAAPMLEQGEMSSLRRLVQEAGAWPGIGQARLVLGQGQVVADSEASRIDPAPVPEAWEGGGLERAEMVIGPDGRVARAPVRVLGRGEAVVELTLLPLQAGLGAAEIPLGVAGSGAGALGVIVLLYRRLRSRVRAYTAIGAALDDGGPEWSRVDAELGEEAAAWNTLVGEVGALREQVSRGAPAASRVEGTSEAGPPGLVHHACDALWQGMLVVDASLRVRYANGAASVLLRATPERVLGAEVGAGLLDERVVALVRSAATGENRRRHVVEIDRSDESARSVLKFSVRPVRRGDAGSALVFIEDVTQQRAADEARQSFVAHATHELRTPLTNVRLYVEEALSAGDSDTGTRSRALNVINQEARRLERIVGDMLCVSEIEAASFRLRRDDVDVGALLDELEADYRAMAEEKGTGLAIERPPKFPALKGDRDKIGLALHNLVGNAIKYTPAGGQVRVRVSAEGESLRVEVSDTGIGIDAGERELIFERFYRSKDARVREQQGSGLGLTLARQVVRLHGGDISVESEVDRGSRFTMIVPLSGQAA